MNLLVVGFFWTSPPAVCLPISVIYWLASMRVLRSVCPPRAGAMARRTNGTVFVAPRLCGHALCWVRCFCSKTCKTAWSRGSWWTQQIVKAQRRKDAKKQTRLIQRFSLKPDWNYIQANLRRFRDPNQVHFSVDKSVATDICEEQYHQASLGKLKEVVCR